MPEMSIMEMWGTGGKERQMQTSSSVLVGGQSAVASHMQIATK